MDLCGGRWKMGKRPEKATVNLKLRVKEPLRASIEAAAEKRGISMNAEMVDRLESSFLSREGLFGGNDKYRFMQVAAAVVTNVEQRTGKSCSDDPDTLEAAKEGVGTLFDIFFVPAGEPTMLSANKKLGELTARQLVDSIKKHIRGQKKSR